MKTWLKKGFVLFLVLFLATSVGCSNNAQDSNGGKVKLDFVWFTDGVEGKVMQEIIKEYEASHPNVKINLLEVPYADVNTKLKTMIAGGKPPALARVTDTGIFRNQALDLTQYVGGTEKFTSQYIDSIRPYYVDHNKVIAAPMDVTVNGLIYNKTLFDKAGVKVPQSPEQVWTWEEFQQALKQVMEKGGAKYGLVVDFTPHRWSTLLYEFGGSIFTKDGSKSALNSGEAVQALEYFKKLHKDGIIPDSVWLGGENPNNLFRTGTVAAHLAGNWMISNYKDIHNFEWGVTYLPKQKVRSSVPGGKFIMGFKNSGVEKETAEFIKYLSSKEVNAKFCQESLLLSPRKDNSELNYEFGKGMFKVFADELAVTQEQAAKDWGNQRVMSKVAPDLKDAIVKVLNGEAKAKESLDQVAEAMNKVIEEESK